MSKEKICECCFEWWYGRDVKEGLCPNCYHYFKQLKQQLKEKDSLIEFGIEEIRKRNKRIDEIVERDKKLFDNKNKELEKLKQQLAEKDIRIEELECQFAYECECNKQLVELQKQLTEKDQRIAELEQELAELKEMSNLIWIDLFHLNNDNNEWTKSLNKYKEEAQEKLKEVQGNE